MEAELSKLTLCKICDMLMKRPAILNCGHSLCSECLDKCWKNEGGKTTRRESGDVRVRCITCPFCKAINHYTGTVNHFIADLAHHLKDRKRKNVICICDDEVCVRKMYKCLTCPPLDIKKPYMCGSCMISLHETCPKEKFDGPDHEVKEAHFDIIDPRYLHNKTQIRSTIEIFLKYCQRDVEESAKLRESAVNNPFLSRVEYEEALKVYRENSETISKRFKKVMDLLEFEISLMDKPVGFGRQTYKDPEPPSISPINTELEKGIQNLNKLEKLDEVINRVVEAKRKEILERFPQRSSNSMEVDQPASSNTNQNQLDEGEEIIKID